MTTPTDTAPPAAPATGRAASDAAGVRHDCETCEHAPDSGRDAWTCARRQHRRVLDGGAFVTECVNWSETRNHAIARLTRERDEARRERDEARRERDEARRERDEAVYGRARCAGLPRGEEDREP